MNYSKFCFPLPNRSKARPSYPPYYIKYAYALKDGCNGFHYRYVLFLIIWSVVYPKLYQYTIEYNGRIDTLLVYLNDQFKIGLLSILGDH